MDIDPATGHQSSGHIQQTSKHGIWKRDAGYQYYYSGDEGGYHDEYAASDYGACEAHVRLA
jgi:hypothetical protein